MWIKVTAENVLMYKKNLMSKIIFTVLCMLKILPCTLGMYLRESEFFVTFNLIKNKSHWILIYHRNTGSLRHT